MPMASKAKTTYSYDRASHKSWLSPYWFTYALCVGDLSKAASVMMLIICSKNKKAIVCGKQNTGLKMREELIVRFLSSGLAHEQKHTDTSHCCWQPVQVHSLLSWSWQKERNAECRNVSNAKSQRYLTSDICQGTCFALMRPWFHIFQPSKERRFYSIIPDN